ncbi:MAG TPA: hypothetical protein VF824_05155 [Thermoanaerobaculia bacterium]
MTRSLPLLMAALAALLLAPPASAQGSLSLSGFAVARDASGSGAMFPEDGPSSQVQLGIDWRLSMHLDAHVHLLGRDDPDGSHRGSAGIVQAYAVARLPRVRIMAGAFFLPTSRENVDDLWESPYTISSSALNTWLGEELRPIGVDVAYSPIRSLTAGATLFRGNDTFGALPIARGWHLGDRWSLLGEHVPVDPSYYTSVSAETDGRLGWSARARWSAGGANVQLTRIDNRSDADEHGDLLNWETPFTIASADFTRGDWTLATEYGWGESTVREDNVPFTGTLSTTYVLLSRRFRSVRATLRAEEFRSIDTRHHAVTAAVFWSPRGHLRAGLETIIAGSDRRVTAELRYSFAATSARP